MKLKIELPGGYRPRLEAVSRDKGVTVAEAIQQAISAYLDAQLPRYDREAFGLWRDRDIDALDYVNRLRSEW